MRERQEYTYPARQRFRKKLKILKDMCIDIPGSDYYNLSHADEKDADRIVRKLINNRDYL